ncbi:dienelactone hydrolase family protein [Streptomyces bambusae]|uniref:phosphoribosyltransferase family protein n=1 Tax=Streptomyces bambusae TaxID=1550616 RepID=UPI001CFCBC7A|nr:phosphoribosyltransferase family protein [Streptomyces bambusae]MCB5165828.1 dienelactone hydrolase family protein [Streptomyces bambusae]
MLFQDRRDAGRQLAARLEHLKGTGVLVLGLPRGGVPVAAEVAAALGAPLDICLVRKLGVPYQPELGMGALGEDGVRVINDEVVRAAGIGPRELARVEARERVVLETRARIYRGGRPPARLGGRTVVIVDDGVATGSTARAACRIVRARGAARTVLAVPVAPDDWTAKLGADADDFVCVHTPRLFAAVGQFYADFTQTEDNEVIACLNAATTRQAARAAGPPGDRTDDVRTGGQGDHDTTARAADRADDRDSARAEARDDGANAGGAAGRDPAHVGERDSVRHGALDDGGAADRAAGRETGRTGGRDDVRAVARDDGGAADRAAGRETSRAGGHDSDGAGARGDGREVDVLAGTVRLRGELAVPDGAIGVVLFAHGSGSSRHSPRNRSVAAGLRRAGLGTLLFDLLTEDEEDDRANVFDTVLLARRLADATAWLRTRPEANRLPVGYFGASTGAAAALWAAAESDSRIAAVVSRGGRPDLAGPRLAAVTAPTLLLVGGDDRLVIGLNRTAQARLRCENRLDVVPGAGHLFEEPGTLDQVTVLAREWFGTHMAPATHHHTAA